jgi:hypothetical protein
MTELVNESLVPVNWGRLLETQLKKWQGGGHHPRGIAEYISNSDDSYRRLKKFCDQKILVEIHSRSTKKIDKLIIQDFAEGMSFDDLENKFFKYFESFSGRERGEQVTGQYGTGGKAYAIMNFRHCTIISVKDGLECKAWFRWDSKKQMIVKGYNNDGFKNKSTSQANGTTIILESSIKVSHPIKDFVIHLEKLPRIRHVLKQQKVTVKIIQNKKTEKIDLVYSGPSESDAQKIWTFPITKNLMDVNSDDNKLILRFFEKPIGNEAFIDLTDGISSVQDLLINKFDSRSFSNYINGSVTITKLFNSSAVKENRRGLEEDDDLTVEIESFIQSAVKSVIDEVEEIQKKLDKERKIQATNEKLNELSKFLSKQDLKFKLELKELKKRFSKTNIELTNIDDENNDLDDLYRKPLPDDPKEILIKGNWVTISEGDGPGREIPEGNKQFLPDPSGDEFAVKIGSRKKVKSGLRKQKQGLKVLMSNNQDIPSSPTFSEYDDPVSDRDLTTEGIIWINSVHPIIVRNNGSKIKEIARDENVANLVLMIVSQYYAEKEAELQPEDERDDPLLLFRKHFFRLQRELRADDDIKFFDQEFSSTDNN